MADAGNVKSLALWIKLKPLFESSHIKDFRKVDTKKIGICRETYYIHLKILEKHRLVRADGVKREGKRRGSKGLIVTGQNKIIAQFPTFPKYNLQYIKINSDENYKELCDRLERIALQRGNMAQSHKIEHEIAHNEKSAQEMEADKQKLIVKQWGCPRQVEMVNPSHQTSYSYKEMAKHIGKRSPATAKRRQRRWKEEGKLVTINRIAELGKLSKEVIRERAKQNEVIFTSNKGISYRQLANQLIFTEMLFLR